MRGLILANRLTELPVFKGFIELLNDFKGALLLAEGIITLVLVVWQLVLIQGKTASVDEEDAGAATKNNKKAIKIILVAAVAIAAATATIPEVLKYFTEG